MNDLATNPQGGEAVSDDQIIDGADAQGVGDDAQDQNLDPADDGLDEDDQQTEDDGEEVEYEGKTFKAPKGVKEAMLRQADYTQKTQALAAERQALAGHQQAFAQHVEVQQSTAQERLNLAVLDHQLSQYSPEALRQIALEQPDQLPLVQLELQQLERQRAALAGAISQKEQRVIEAQRQQAARQLDDARQTLARDIKDWDKNAKTVFSHGQAQYGFTPQELGQVADPRMIKVLHDAWRWNQHQQQTQQTRKVQQQQQTQPVRTIGQRGAGGRIQADAATTDFTAFERMANAKT